MALRITHDMMTLGIDNHVVATARFSEHAVGRRYRRVERLHAFARLLTRGRAWFQPVEPDRLMCALSVCRRHRDVRCRAGARLPGCLGKGHGAALNRASTRR
jgi:hypothetical protein